VADYLKFAVPHVWIADPYRQRLQEADADGMRDRPDSTVETALVGSVDFRELFGRLDEPSE